MKRQMKEISRGWHDLPENEKHALMKRRTKEDCKFAKARPTQCFQHSPSILVGSLYLGRASIARYTVVCWFVYVSQLYLLDECRAIATKGFKGYETSFPTL